MSLLELLITLSISSVLAVTGFMTYGFYYQNKELEGAAQTFISNINYAKEASIITGKTIYLCASTDHQSCNPMWHGDLITFSSNSPQDISNVLKIAPPLPADMTFEINLGGFTQNAYLRFMGSGELVNAGNFSFSKDTLSKKFTISITGIIKPIVNPHKS